ncbi:hypothetical protein ACTA71_010220 [Dictyostelium dimigraforme]
MITLPIYLQKYIIKLICFHIDYNNGLIDVQGVFDDYRKDEKKMKELMLTIALVSKEWFKTLSDNLIVDVDFNYKEKGKDQYSIIKMENVETLKVHYNHQGEQFYKMFGGSVVIDIPIETVNEKIMKLSTMEGTNFKYLILRNVNYMNDIDIINRIYQCKQTNDHSVSLCEFALDLSVDLDQINQLKKKVSKIFTLLIYETSNFEIILETFKQWSNTLNHLLVPYSERTFSIIDKLSSSYNDNYSCGSNGNSGSNRINYLSNLKLCDFNPVSISELYTLIKSTPKLKYISIGFCLNSFLYYLSNEFQHKQHQQHQQHQQQQQQNLANIYKELNVDNLPEWANDLINEEIVIKNNHIFEGSLFQKFCTCNNFSNEVEEGTLITEYKKSIKFSNYLSNIIKYLNENENTINQLRIYNFCSDLQFSLHKVIYNAPDFLIEKLVSLISSFKYLKIFEAHFFNEKLFNQLVIKNPSITHYRITVPKEIISDEYASTYSNNILIGNLHIVEFKFN